jgi:hypothetical protein
MAVEQLVTSESMVFERAGGTMVVAHGPDNPGEAVWASFVATMKELRSEVGRVLVFSAGGSPNAKQRAHLRQQVGTIHAAILTDSIVARGAVTALSWLGLSIAAFAPPQVTGAMDYIGVPPDERELVRRTLGHVKARVI